MKIFVAALMALTVVVSGKRKGKGRTWTDVLFYYTLGPGTWDVVCGITNVYCLEDHGTIIRCMAESYWSGQGEDTIKACRECFKDAGKNPLSGR